MPYDELEKLRILIEAIDLGLVSSAKMERLIPDNLGKGALPIEFMSDEGTPSSRHEITSSDDSKRVRATDELATVIERLRGIL